jgi:hypothetical protein
MADDLNRPFIGYRSAGRRPESQQDRRAAADAPLSALRGMVSGVLGAPGDIESLIRMLPGLSEQTVLPTSEDIEKRLPMRELNQTPTGKAFTTAGQLGGGFYTGPGSPLRAVAALPSAVSRAGRDFAMAAGQPAVNVVKPKGGNWLAGSVERAIEPMQKRVTQAAEQNFNPAQGMTFREIYSQDALNKWLETKLAKYMRNEMATPEDPLRALAERGITHTEIQPTGYNVAVPRSFAGFPEEGMAKSPQAKLWEDKSDTFVSQLLASDITKGYPGEIANNPWLLKVPPETRVYDMLRGADEDLGFSHLADELRNAINPESGLPRELMLKYSDLEKVTVPQAVERVAKINDWRAAQKAEADMARAMGPATQVVKEYPEQGYKWVELRQPKETGRKVTVERSDMELPDMTPEMMREVAEDMAYDAMLDPGTREFNDHVEGLIADFSKRQKREVDESYKSLEDALKYEGETMGHCVGGYCPDVVEGRSKIYSLRDKKGQPHVTIEVQPWRSSQGESLAEFEARLRSDPNRSEQAIQDIMSTPQYRDSIVQIKGKGNKAPKEDYLPAVQDFVRSGNFGKVGDLGNTGLYRAEEITNFVPESFYATKAEREAAFEKAKAAGKIQDYMTRAEWEDALKSEMPPPTPGPTMEFLREMGGLPPEGFARGGAVRGYQAGGAARTLPELHQRYAEGGAVTGANFPTDDYDPARIDAIVAGLQAEMQS